MLAEHALYGGRRDAMELGDLAQALAMLAVALDSGMVQHQRIAADVLAFEPGAPHAGAHSLDNQVAFQFSDGADDDHDGPAQRATGVDIFLEADLLDLKPAELVQDFEEVLHRPGDPVRCPDQDNIEPAAAGISHHLIEAWPAGLGAADPVVVLVDNFVAALAGHLAEVVELRFRMLIESRHPHIESGAFHPRRLFLGVTLPCLAT